MDTRHSHAKKIGIDQGNGGDFNVNIVRITSLTTYPYRNKIYLQMFGFLFKIRIYNQTHI